MDYYWVTSSLVPFDDTQSRKYKLPTTSSQGIGQSGINLSLIDNYRQGVEITLSKHVYDSNQPKLWGGRVEHDGRINHQINTFTYGQAVSFTEFFGTNRYNDNLRTFNPVTFIELGNEYPYPIIYNDGPQAQQEAIIEPLTIPMRLQSVESLYYIHDVHGYLEDGNHLDGLRYGNSQIRQYIPYSSSVCRPFLDDGEVRWGETFSGSIYIEGYQSNVQRKLSPFNDLDDKFVLNKLSSFTSSDDSNTMKTALLNLKYNFDNEEERKYNEKGASAGYDIYGPQQAQYGRDSIVYIGMLRGS